MGAVLTDEPDLVVFREEPLVDIEDEFGPSFFILLRNFELNSQVLKPQHRDVLRDRVLDVVKTNVGFAELYAMTDRSGSRQMNYKVSDLRLTDVQRHLLGLGAPLAKIIHPFAKAIGEDFWKTASIASTARYSRTAAKTGSCKIFRTRFVAEVLGFCRFHQQKT